MYYMFFSIVNLRFVLQSLGYIDTVDVSTKKLTVKNQQGICGKVFKNGRSKIYERQPLKKSTRSIHEYFVPFLSKKTLKVVLLCNFVLYIVDVLSGSGFHTANSQNGNEFSSLYCQPEGNVGSIVLNHFGNTDHNHLKWLNKFAKPQVKNQLHNPNHSSFKKKLKPYLAFLRPCPDVPNHNQLK